MGVAGIEKPRKMNRQNLKGCRLQVSHTAKFRSAVKIAALRNFSGIRP